MLPLFGDRKAYKFLTGDFVLIGAEFSPDGRWFSYTSDESGQSQLYVVAFPGPGGTGWGADPRRRPPGRRQQESISARHELDDGSR